MEIFESIPPLSERIDRGVYASDSLHGEEGWRIWWLMIRDMLSCHELVWRLISRDISARYRQSLCGYIWAVVPALATVSVSAFLASSSAVSIRETPLSYVAYASWSVGDRQLFSSSITACTSSLASQNAGGQMLWGSSRSYLYF